MVPNNPNFHTFIIDSFLSSFQVECIKYTFICIHVISNISYDISYCFRKQNICIEVFINLIFIYDDWVDCNNVWWSCLGYLGDC